MLSSLVQGDAGENNLLVRNPRATCAGRGVLQYTAVCGCRSFHPNLLGTLGPVRLGPSTRLLRVVILYGKTSAVQPHGAYQLMRTCTNLAPVCLANSFGSTIKCSNLGFTKPDENIISRFNTSQQYVGMNPIGLQYPIRNTSISLTPSTLEYLKHLLLTHYQILIQYPTRI